MFKKIFDMFDVRTGNKWFNVFLGALISFMLAWSTGKVFFEDGNAGFTVLVFFVLWVPLAIGELHDKEKAEAKRKAKQEAKAKAKAKNKKKKKKK